MLNSGFLILFGVSIANMVLGTVILAKNSKNRVNVAYFTFVIALTIWVIFNYFTDNVHSLNVSLWCARFANAFGLLAIYLFWQFCAFFAARKSFYHFWKTLPIAIVGIIVSLSPLGVKEITGFDKAAIQVLGILYPIVIAAMFICFGGTLYELRIGRKNARDVLAKRNIRLIVIGITFAFGMAILTNILLPIFTKSWNVSQFGPIFTLFLVVCVAAGIVRNKLFDIRPIIARSFAYIFSLTTLGLLYGLIAFVLLDRLLFTDTKTLVSQRATYTILALIFGLSFTPAKKAFDKLSDRIFYRDAYDAQVFIDNLTSILVGNTDITKLLHDSSELIGKTLKSSFTKFLLNSNDGKNHRLIGKSPQEIKESDIQDIFKNIHRFPMKVIDTEAMDMSTHGDLKKTLQDLNIALVVKLNNHKELSGLLLIGAKQSGNVYTTKDINIFEIVADELSLAIQNSLRYEEIESFNLTLQQKVQNATSQLRHTNEKLKALDEAKDEFISMASHQLRTPLTSVKGYVSMVLEGDAGKISSQQKQLLEQAFTSSQRMVYLIADLLNVSRLKTGKFIIEAKPTVLTDVVEGEMQQLKESIKAHKLELTFIKPESFPVLNLDETKTRQVIMNFMDNAIYYTPAGGHIKVELNATDKEVTYKVIDDGLGVPKAEQHHLFTKFFRAGNAKKARPDGTGLGLYMAKKVIVAQGGSLIFESQEGKGSTFGFSFPRAALEVHQ